MTSRAIKREPEDAKSVHHICRLCLSKESLEDVFSADRGEGDLRQWIQEYLSITITAADCLGHAVCSICRLRLAEFHQFRIRSQEVQGVLQSMIPTSTAGETEVTVVKLEYTEQDQEEDSDAAAHDESPEEHIGIKDMIVIEDVKIEAHKDDEDDDDESQITLDNPEDGMSITEEINSDSRSHKSNTDVKQYQCDICSKVLANSVKLDLHKRTHNKKLECSICGKPLLNRWEVKRHERTHSSIEDRQGEHKPFKCITCQKSFMFRNEITCHIKTVHQSRNHECHVCGYKFVRRTCLERHLQLHNLYGEGEGKQCTSPQPKKPRNQLSSKSKSDSTAEEKTIECKDCHKMFRTVRDLWRHFNYSHMKKFKCSSCDAAFATNKLLEKHTKFHVTEEVESARVPTVETVQQVTSDKHQHQCDICFKVFSNSGKLYAHKYFHRKEVTCSVCEKPFTNRSQVERHMRSHLTPEERWAEQKPFQCDKCPKAFRLQTQLNAHEKIVHGPKTHECHICGIKFSKRANLKSHVRTHILCGDGGKNE